jgi:16S rRNA (adenine1518-N6/adenine1519-N6)-dimethyltransferase
MKKPIFKKHNSDDVTAKKHLGQHFLLDLNASKRIADGLTLHGNYKKALEIGPGMGVLTQFLLERTEFETSVVEIDTESVVYLKKNYAALEGRILSEDFLKMPLDDFDDQPFAIVGNFPYNISSQIFFKVLEHKDKVSEVVCMLQKEVAKRIASGPGKKDYGILSVFLQAYYDIEYLFTLGPGAFNPPPKVDSGVIRLKRNAVAALPCNEKVFWQMVKAGFNQRRKTLRNALKVMGLKPEFYTNPILDRRAETLSVHEFVDLVNTI